MIDTHTIIPKASYPTPKINTIFENYENDKYDNASLYQNILEYANLPKVKFGFRFTEVGKWLMEKNNEFKNYYSDSKAHTPISARIANKRQRIQNCINNLKKWDFLTSKMVTAKKNYTETPLYVITPLGKIVSLIIKAKFSTIEEEKNNAIKQIIDIVTSIREQNDSAIVLFITELLNHLWENNKTNSIIQHIDRTFMLELNSGNDFLSYFLGIKHFLYLFISNWKISLKILENLTDEKQKIILINLKTEIEYYYQQNYLLKDEFFKKNILPIGFIDSNYGNLFNSGVLPSAYWENARINYSSSFSKVVVPSFCNTCNSHRAFVVDVTDYLKSVSKSFAYPSIDVSGKCMECKKVLFTYDIRHHLN